MLMPISMFIFLTKPNKKVIYFRLEIVELFDGYGRAIWSSIIIILLYDEFSGAWKGNNNNLAKLMAAKGSWLYWKNGYKRVQSSYLAPSLLCWNASEEAIKQNTDF